MTHIRRRLSLEEASAYGLIVEDIRGTDLEQIRLQRVVAELNGG